MKPRDQKTTVLLLAVLILALFSLLPATALAADGTPELQALPELQTEQTPAQTLSASGATISPDTKVYYVDGRGMRQLSPAAFEISEELGKTWAEGWYVLRNDLTISGSIEYSGDVNLILCNNKTLTVDGFTNSGEGGSLTIYVQSLEDTEQGALEIKTSAENGIHAGNGDVTVNGGKITISAGSYGIRTGSGKITLASGSVNIDGNKTAAVYTESGNVTIAGGDITLSGHSGIRADNGNIDMSGGSLTASGFNAAAIFAGGDVNINGGIVSTADGGQPVGIHAGGSFTMSKGILYVYGNSRGIEHAGPAVIAESLTVMVGNNQKNESRIDPARLGSHRWVHILTADPLEPVSYMAWDDARKTLVEKTGDEACKIYEPLGDHDQWYDACYVLRESMSLNHSILVLGNVSLILCDGASLDVPSIETASWSTLNIYAQSTGDNQGALNAGGINGDRIIIHGGKIFSDGTVDNIAGIGGNVTIHGGEIIARGGRGDFQIGDRGGPGIGGTVTINGGTVDAIGYAHAAGIGGQQDWNGTVTINGGSVKALSATPEVDGGSGGGGAGIGGGFRASGTVVITGGTVEAKSTSGAGIGGGSLAPDDTSVTISGGTVIATTAKGTAIGIDSDAKAQVTISGGDVTATATAGGAGIGGRSANTTVTLSGGTVTASGANGVAEQCTVILDEGVNVYAGNHPDPKSTGVYVNDTFAEWHLQPYVYAETGPRPDPHTHTDHDGATFTFQPWTDLLAKQQNGEQATACNSLPSAAGSYFLTDHVDLGDSTWTPGVNINLCLHGYTVTSAAAGGTLSLANGVVLNLFDDVEYDDDNPEVGGRISNTNENAASGVTMDGAATLNIYTGLISGNKVQNDGGGVSVNGNSTLNMYGGAITENKTAGRGGGVFLNNGTFNMFGGTITQNTAESYGGGVYLGTEGRFIVHGGVFVNNYTSAEGGAVYVGEGSMRLSGNPSIRANYREDLILNNIFVDSTPFTIDGEITERDSNTQIGISMKEPGIFATGGTEGLRADDDWRCFSTDSEDYSVLPEGDAIKLVDRVQITEMSFNDLGYMQVDDVKALVLTVKPENTSYRYRQWLISGDRNAVKLYTDEACTTELGPEITPIQTVYVKGSAAGTIGVRAIALDSWEEANTQIQVHRLNYADGDVTPPTARTLVYTGSAQELINPGSVKPERGGAMVYAKSAAGGYEPADADYSETVPTAVEAGDYTVWYKIRQNDVYTEYQRSFINVSIASGPDQTIEAEDVTVTYGETDKRVSAVSKEGGAISYAVKSGSEEYLAVDASTGALTVRKVPAEGKAIVTVTAAAIGEYTETNKDVTVTINKADPSVTPPTGKELPYDGFSHQLVDAGSADGGTMYYAASTESTAPDQSAYREAIPQEIERGTYYVWYRVEGDENHNNTEARYVTSIINNALLNIRYDANGGTGAPESQLKTYGEPLQLSAQKPEHADSVIDFVTTLDPNGGTLDGETTLHSAETTVYTFQNWNTAADGSGTAYEPGASYTDNVSVTLYAQWESMTGRSKVMLPVPTREGYSYNGWSIDPDADHGAMGEYEPTDSRALYATWKLNQYTLSFDTDGGTEIAPITLDYGAAITAPADPIKEDYIFTDWEPALPATMPAQDITVKAMYKPAHPMITGADLVLGGTLDLRFYLQVPDDFDPTGTYMSISIGGRNARSNTYEYAEGLDVDGKRVFSFPVYSIEMAEPVSAVFHYGTDGEATLTASVKEYLEKLEADGGQDAIIAAVRNYGHYMQPYLSTIHGFTVGEGEGYDYEAMPAAGEITPLTELEAYRRVWGENAYDANVLKSMSYYDTFNESTTLNIRLRFKAVPGTVTATVDGGAWDINPRGDKVYQIEIRNIAANALGTPMHVVVTADGKIVYDVHISALSYVSAVLASNRDQAGEREALTAFYKYFEAAKAYGQQ